MSEETGELWRKLLEEWLAKIGWSLAGRGCRHYQLMDNKNEPSILEFFYDRIEIKAHKDNISITFHLKDCKFEVLENSSLAIQDKTDKSIFILLHNWEKADEEKTKK